MVVFLEAGLQIIALFLPLLFLEDILWGILWGQDGVCVNGPYVQNIGSTPGTEVYD